MSTEATYLVAPQLNNYQSIDRTRSVVPGSKKFPKSLSPSELKEYLDDPMWVAFRIVVLILLIVTFSSLLCLAVWICYNEYVYNCNPHPTTRKPPHIIDSLLRNSPAQ